MKKKKTFSKFAFISKNIKEFFEQVSKTINLIDNENISR